MTECYNINDKCTWYYLKERYIMDKEKILSQNKKENLYLDEYEKHIKLQGKSFGLMFVLFICILILFIKAVCKEPYYDIMTIIGVCGIWLYGL